MKAYPELYFARFVVLAEGESEAIVISRLSQAMGIPLDRSFVPVVPLGGRFVTHFWRLLEGLEIPYATLLDLDLGRQHGGVKAIRTILSELDKVGRNLGATREAVDGDIDINGADDIDDAELLADGPGNPWLSALREMDVYFSFPIDVDFAMVQAFPAAYARAPMGRPGPRLGEDGLAGKKARTLKKRGNVALYDGDDAFDEAFLWYPYLFLGASKPEGHLLALDSIDDETLVNQAPQELVRLVRAIGRTLAG